MKVYQLENTRGRAWANQFVIEGNGKTQLQSYSSIVVSIEENGDIKLGPDWDYSNTTRRAVYKFLDDHDISLHSDAEVRKALKAGKISNSWRVVNITEVEKEEEM